VNLEVRPTYIETVEHPIRLGSSESDLSVYADCGYPVLDCELRAIEIPFWPFGAYSRVLFHLLLLVALCCIPLRRAHLAVHTTAEILFSRNVIRDSEHIEPGSAKTDCLGKFCFGILFSAYQTCIEIIFSRGLRQQMNVYTIDNVISAIEF